MTNPRGGGHRGFTLVELMASVAIVGVLAVVAIVSTARYIDHAKAAEAKQNVGGIARAAVAAYDRGFGRVSEVKEGSSQETEERNLCYTAIPVPLGLPPANGRKYQPRSADGADFQSGSDVSGWSCLHFGVDQPMSFQLSYFRDASFYAPKNPAACSSGSNRCFEASARANLRGNGEYTTYALTGRVTQGGGMALSTAIHEQDSGCSLAPGEPAGQDHAGFYLLAAAWLLWRRRGQHGS